MTKSNVIKPLSSRLGCFAARHLIHDYHCERIVELTARLKIRLDYKTESKFMKPKNDFVLSRYVPRIPSIQIFSDQIFLFQKKLKKRNVTVDFNQLVYHAIACEVGHHLWYQFMKQYPGQRPYRFFEVWGDFETWLNASFPETIDVSADKYEMVC